MIEWLGAMIRATDATLLDEWEMLARGTVTERDEVPSPPVSPPGPPAAWRTMVRTAAFGWVELLAARSYGALAERSGWSAADISAAMAAYWDEYDAVLIDADARAACRRSSCARSPTDGSWCSASPIPTATASGASSPPSTSPQPWRKAPRPSASSHSEGSESPGRFVLGSVSAARARSKPLASALVRVSG